MTIRVRLTLVYGLLFLAAGAGLLTISYGIVHHELPNKVSPVTAQDVRARAQKLSTSEKLDDATRAKLQQIAKAPDADIKTLIAGPDALPSAIAKPLLADLPSTVRADALHSLITGSLLALGLMTVVAAALGWVVAGRFIRPIGVITETAQRLSAENLHQRLALRGPDDELKRLADTFDGMLGRLDAAFEGQRRFVANASHELRTPLTIMRTEVDVALRKPDASVDDFRAMAGIVRATLERADRLVSSLLALAAAQHGPEVSESVDLADITRVTLAHRATDAAARELRITADLGSAPVAGDPGLLDRVTENLIENAIVHNVDQGWLRVRTAVEDEHSVLDVSNSGPAVTAEDLERLFQPFARATRSEPGRSTGLGLSVVKSVVEAHHGSVTAEALDAGGLRVVARFDTDAEQPGLAHR